AAERAAEVVARPPDPRAARGARRGAVEHGTALPRDDAVTIRDERAAGEAIDQCRELLALEVERPDLPVADAEPALELLALAALGLELEQRVEAQRDEIAEPLHAIRLDTDDLDVALADAGRVVAAPHFGFGRGDDADRAAQPLPQLQVQHAGHHRAVLRV